MDAAGTPADLWAALHAQSDVPTMQMPLQRAPHDYSAHSNVPMDDDSDDDDNDDDDDDGTTDQPSAATRASHAPLLLPQGGLPPSFYATTGLPDVVPSFMMTHLTPKPFTDSSGTPSEMFLDDILRSHDDAFSASLTGGASASAHAELAPSGRLTVERLSQLEDNYERKKKRAKINRRDLNSRFQELMDLLHLKEDRKLNRAKVLEKAVEHIHKLTAELKAAKAQLEGGGANLPPSMPYHQSMAPFTPSRTPGLALHALPAAPVSMQQWPGPSPMGMNAPMMWMPMAPAIHSRPNSRPSSATSNRSSGRRQTVKAAVATATTQTSPDRTNADMSAVRRPGLKRTREHETALASSTFTAATLVWIAQEVHSLLEFCDGWSLGRLLCTSRDLRTAARRGTLWRGLCQRRWRLTPTDATADDAFVEWTQRHSVHSVPRSIGVHSSCVQFAAGTARGVGLWVSLVHRSNGRTTRTVLVDGRAVVRQVVELTVLVQNNHPHGKLRLLDELQVSSSAGRFQLITANSRAHLTPHLVAVNDVTVATSSVADVELLHGDLCVLSVFVECDGLDLEQEFLERVSGVTLRCELSDSKRVHCDVLDVCARVDAESTRAQISALYSPTAAKPS